jgi:hypothetical protein
MMDEYESLPASGNDAEELVGFIKSETPREEYFRQKRDMDREMTLFKKQLREHMNELERLSVSIYLIFEQIDKFHKKYIDGSSEEDDIY